MSVSKLFQPLSNDAISLIISSVLILACVLWFVFIFTGQKTYRFSGIETGLFIFLIAGAVSIFAASNKRAAITDFVTIVLPMLMAVVLVQILDSTSRIKLVLLVVIALGVVSAHQCADQFLSSNDIMIRNYMNDPDSQLTALGIEEGSLKQFLYEHRLFSKDVRGFLTTSNSTGSFLLLAGFAGIGMLIEKVRYSFRVATASTICVIFLAGVIVTGLIFTHSKGALSAGAAALVMLIIFLILKERIYRYRKAIIIAILLAGVFFVFAVVSYGNAHGRLPGGNSMLVRWQYWVASAKMYLEKPFTGIGGGNFKTYYTYYKDPSAIEVVNNPHSFVFSLLTQYGAFGFIGFVVAAMTPVFRGLFQKQNNSRGSLKPANVYVLLEWVALFAIMVTLLLIRPIVKFDRLGEDPSVITSVILILYVTPACIFLFGFCVTLLAIKHYPYRHGFGLFVKPAILFGLIAVLIANLIDFAIFEPGVLMLFWTLAAVVTAIDYNNGSRQSVDLSGKSPARYLTVISMVIATVVYISYGLIPPIKTSVKVMQAITTDFNYAIQKLDFAITADRFDPGAANLKGRMLLGHYNASQVKNISELEEAVECFKLAIKRDNADNKNFADLGRTYELLAESQSDDKKQEMLQRSFEAMKHAVDRYPGSAGLQADLGKIAEKTGAAAEASEYYKKAIEIEDAYRCQFKIMYPYQKIVSRLGEQEYKFALERIEALKKQRL